MTAAADEEARRAGRARAVALFRYSLIREAADPELSTRQRGRLVRELASRPHAGPFGEQVTVSRPSLDRWIRAWRSGGFDALAPPARQVTPRTPAEVLALAGALKRENPDRTAAQVARVLRASGGWSPSERTLQRHFTRLELTTRPGGSPPPVSGRFEAARPNELWTGDALHGPSSPPTPPARPSSTNPTPAPRPPRSPQTDHQAATTHTKAPPEHPRRGLTRYPRPHRQRRRHHHDERPCTPPSALCRLMH